MKAKTLYKYQNKKHPSQMSSRDTGEMNQEEFIFVKSNSALQKIELLNLRYIEAQGDYIIFATTKDEILVNMTMTKALEILPAASFCRVHKSYIIAIKWIDLIKDDTIHIGRIEIPIGSSYKKDLLERINPSL
jgi:DNA-binding LytR/AlgR family response regulator